MWERASCTSLPALVLAAVLTACSPTAPEPEARESAAPESAAPERAPGEVAEPALRDELLEMQRQDQLERTGEGLPPGTRLPPARDFARSQRLREIIAEHGWPTYDLVGRDGGTAAWLVAQHADFDPAWQEEVVGLLREAVDAGQADPTELAYLQDRVAVNRGEPQTYGTQIRCRAGAPDPATPLTDPEGVDALRETVGLGPLADYYDELAMMCADEAAEGAQPAP